MQPSAFLDIKHQENTLLPWVPLFQSHFIPCTTNQSWIQIISSVNLVLCFFLAQHIPYEGNSLLGTTPWNSVSCLMLKYFSSHFSSQIPPVSTGIIPQWVRHLPERHNSSAQQLRRWKQRHTKARGWLIGSNCSQNSMTGIYGILLKALAEEENEKKKESKTPQI